MISSYHGIFFKMLERAKQRLTQLGHDDNSPTIQHLDAALESLGGVDLQMTNEDLAYLNLLSNEIVVADGFLLEPQEFLERKLLLTTLLKDSFQNLIKGLQIVSTKKLLGLIPYEGNTQKASDVTIKDKVLSRSIEINPHPNVLLSNPPYASLNYSSDLGSAFNIDIFTSFENNKRHFRSAVLEIGWVGNSHFPDLISSNFNFFRNFLKKYLIKFNLYGHTYKPHITSLKFDLTNLRIEIYHEFRANEFVGSRTVKQTLTFSTSLNKFLHACESCSEVKHEDYEMTVEHFVTLINTFLRFFGEEGFFHNFNSDSTAD